LKPKIFLAITSASVVSVTTTTLMKKEQWVHNSREIIIGRSMKDSILRWLVASIAKERQGREDSIISSRGRDRNHL